MKENQLFTTTALSSPAPPSLRSVRSHAMQLAERGNASEAISYLCYLFFQSSSASRSEASKKSILRAVWQVIETREEELFRHSLLEALNEIAEVYEWEWNRGVQLDLLYSSADSLHADVIEARQRAIVMGKCTALVDLMTRGDCVLIEELLSEIEQMLHVLMGE